MAVGQITWEKFITSNNDARGIRYKFEDLSRQLFAYEFLSKNNVYKYIHSNPNNPGIESEPILDEINNRYIGYQAKFFDNDADYNQIKESAQKAVKYYKGKVEVIYLFCNKPLTTTSDSYRKIEKLLNDAGIALQPITDTAILDLVRKYPSLGKYYFDDHGISHEWFVNKASITIDVLGERFNADFNVDTEASRSLSVFVQNQAALNYYNDRKKNLVEEIASLRWELDVDGLYKYARKLSEFIVTIPDVKFDCIHDAENWQEMIFTEFQQDALNESWKPQLWKSVLPILHKKISEKNYVRLAVSFRSEYQNSILPDGFLKLDNIVKIEHRGFKDNPFKAARQFLSYYGIQFTPLHMFNANIYNPLFLTLYCKTYRGDEVELPVLYERLLEKANDKGLNHWFALYLRMYLIKR